MKILRVLVVDDSPSARALLSRTLGLDPRIEVVGVAEDAYVARDMIKRLNPDVMTLDIEMPKMNGLQFLQNVMRLRPMPVVMVSGFSLPAANITLQALEAGAVDFVCKPSIEQGQTLERYMEEIVAKVITAGAAKVGRFASQSAPVSGRPAAQQSHSSAKASNLTHIQTLAKKNTTKGVQSIIAIGSSTGGTEAVRDVITALPRGLPGIVITQHIPKLFSASFAARLDGLSVLDCSEARDGDEITRSRVLVAPGDRHLEVYRVGGKLRCRLTDAEKVSQHRPSVDVLFDSVNQAVGMDALSVILTGMGKDGAQGMLHMKQSGALTIAQNEATSVVWGMPGSAVKLDAVDHVLALNRIASMIVELSSMKDESLMLKSAIGH